MKIKKRYIFIIAINALCLIGILVCQLISSSITSPLYTGQAAKTWSGESGDRFAHLSVYFPSSYDFDDAMRYQLRNTIESSLISASLGGDEDRRYYTDAWSAAGTVNVRSQGGSANASVIGVGGDYFLFHPLRLRSGSYISPSDIMRDRIVLDEDLAWRLFGSVDLAGMEVLINDRPFIVAGVIARETDRASKKAYSGEPGIYMSIEMLDAMTGGNVHVDSYDIVLPDIVTDFALTMLQGALSNESLHIVDNTSRFSFASLLSVIGSYGQRSMREDSVAYPYWENAVRYAEDWAALMLFISLLLLICPAAFSIIYIIKLSRVGVRKFKIIVRVQVANHDKRAYEKYLQKQSETPVEPEPEPELEAASVLTAVEIAIQEPVVRETEGHVQQEETIQKENPLQAFIEKIRNIIFSIKDMVLSLIPKKEITPISPEPISTDTISAEPVSIDARDLWSQGSFLAREGDYIQAIDFMEKALAEDSDNPDYLCGYGNMLARTERYDEAVKQISKAIKKDSSIAFYHYSRASIYRNMFINALLSSESVATAKTKNLHKKSLKDCEKALELIGDDDARRDDILRVKDDVMKIIDDPEHNFKNYGLKVRMKYEESLSQ